MNLFSLFRECLDYFKRSGISDFELEARFIIQHVLDLDLKSILGQPHREISVEDCDRIRDLCQKRLTGMPLAYVLGEWEFHGHRYEVGPGVLIPRPETELVLLEVKQLVHELGLQDRSFTLLELGLGSGILSIELAKLFPQTRVIGWEISADAYAICERNIRRHEVTVGAYLGDFFEFEMVWGPVLNSDFPVIFVSNPPYISEVEFSNLDSGVKDFEPKQALLAADEGLNFYRRLFSSFSVYRRVPMVMEIGHGQGGILRVEVKKAGWNGRVVPDLAGLNRVLVCIPE